jgi:predicted membrane-bound spermidine synthase
MYFQIPRIVYLIFFLSGAAALIFETLWFRLAELVFGNSVWGAALVLSGFMAGLAIGNFLVARYGPHIKKPMSIYAGLEVMIGFSGFILVLILPGFQELLIPLYRPFLDHLVALNLVRLVIVFILLLIPTMAMGTTLPIMVKSLSSIDNSFGSVLGNLYGINTVGAVTGVLICEFLLINYLGMENTGKLAASLNLGAALLALRIAPYMDQCCQRSASSNEKTSINFSLLVKNRNLLIAAFLSGAILLALEIIWFRFLQLFSFGTSQIFATMLAVVLAGIGMGGLLASVLFRIENHIVRYIKEISLLGGILILIVYISFNRFISFLSFLGVPEFTSFVLYSLFLMFPVSLLSGLLFTSLGNAIKKNNITSTGAAGLLTLSNTTGAMCGALVAGFLLLSYLGMEMSFYVLALCYGLIALLVPGQYSTLRMTGIIVKPISLMTAIYLLILGFFPFGEMDQVFFKRIADGYGASSISSVSEGTVATNMYLKYDNYGKPEFYRLVTNSHSMSATNIHGKRYMKLFVYLPVALHPGVSNALLISYGHGSTAKALVDTASIRSIDIVDISKEILNMSDVLYSSHDNPLHDVRVNVHIEDGRFFLLTTPHQYDLITGEPPPPKGAGIVNLYSQEYFKLLYGRLNEGGIATYWLPTHGLYLSDSKAIIKAFCNIFNDCSLWNGSGLDWILMGTKNSAGPVTYEHFTAQWRTPNVAHELKFLGIENAAQLGATFIADADFLKELTKNSLPVTDNFPRRLSPDIAFDNVSFYPYYNIMSESDTMNRFMHSKYIEQIWPRPLRQETVKYFKYQRMINKRIVSEYRESEYGKNDEQPLNDLHDVLTNTSLETLPLWLMNSDDVQQSIIHQLMSDNIHIHAIPAQLALQAIAKRDYAEAIKQIELYLKTNATENKSVMYSLYLYSLSVSGRIEEANILMTKTISSFPPNRENILFITWLHDSFGLDIPKKYMQ